MDRASADGDRRYRAGRPTRPHATEPIERQPDRLCLGSTRDPSVCPGHQGWLVLLVPFARATSRGSDCCCARAARLGPSWNTRRRHGPCTSLRSARSTRGRWVRSHQRTPQRQGGRRGCASSSFPPSVQSRRSGEEFRGPKNVLRPLEHASRKGTPVNRGNLGTPRAHPRRRFKARRVCEAPPLTWANRRGPDGRDERRN